MSKLALLRDPKYRGSLDSLPMCQLLLSKGKGKDVGIENNTAILYVKEESLKLSGWLNIPGEGQPYKHLYKNADKLDNGIAFLNPRIQWLGTSPRLVEVTENGFAAGIGRKGEILANYELPEGKDLYNKYKNNKKTKSFLTLRTIHLISLVGKDGKLLHKVPFTLVLHGGAATLFGQQLKSFFRELEVVYSETQQDEFFTLNEEARCLAIFEPTLDVETVGEAPLTSDIAGVVGYKQPTIDNLETEIFNFDLQDKLQGLQRSFTKDTNFAERYLLQAAKYHPVQDMASIMSTSLTQLPEYNEEEEDTNAMDNWNTPNTPADIGSAYKKTRLSKLASLPKDEILDAPPGF